jgi:hypothetical protein
MDLWIKSSIAFLLFFVSACQGCLLEVGPRRVVAGDAETAAKEFELLKQLQGDWVGETTIDGKVTEIESRWRVTAAGTAVMETLFAGTQHEMVTVFHRDGDSVLATHYCSAGNQPRIRSVGGGMLNAHPSLHMERYIEFDYVDSANLKSPDDAHIGALLLAIYSDKLIERWSAYAKGKVDHEAEFVLTRKP